MPNRMERVSTCDSFDALPAPYEALFRDAGAASIFSSLPWFRNFAQTVLPPDARVRIYGVHADSPERLALALPLYYETRGAGKIGPRRLLGLGNYYTPLFGPVVSERSGCAQDCLNALATALVAGRPKWDMLDLHPLAAETPLFDALLTAFHGAGMMATSYFRFGNWYLAVNNRSYREYHDTLPSVLRNTIRRKTARLEKSGRLRVQIVTDSEGLDGAIAAFGQVYNASWKTPEPYPRFIPGLIRACAKQGWLRLGIAHIDGVPAAAQLWMVSAGVASIYKLAYDERFAADSVGSILTSRLMQHVIDIDKVREVDFLSGDDPYKRDWMSHRRERRGIIVFNLRTPHGMLGALKHMGGRLRKRLAAPRTVGDHDSSEKSIEVHDNRPQ